MRKCNGPVVGAMDTSPHLERTDHRTKGEGWGRGNHNKYAFDIFLRSFPMHWNHEILFLKGPGQPHLCLFLREFDHYILFGHVEAKEISETNKDERKYFLGTQRKFKQYYFTWPCNINNGDVLCFKAMASLYMKTWYLYQLCYRTKLYQLVIVG